MDFEVLIVFSFAAFVCSGIYKLIKMKMQSNNAGVDEEKFNRLARAFVEYKKEMTNRVENLETIIAESDTTSDVNFGQIEASDSDSKLTNDLNQKNKVRS